MAKAINDIDEPLNEGLNHANQKITEQLLLGKVYEEVLNDGA
ncbi:hypothetical protein [Bathymodiolus thermophilus thioautotrophic gill symbiont]|nr:hypothetical protein [Bathymodiolus thermophilus thioautotrophic gill symbiont]